MGGFVQEKSLESFRRVHYALRGRAELSYEALEAAMTSMKSLDNGIRLLRDGAVRCFNVDVDDSSTSVALHPAAHPTSNIHVSALVHSKQTTSLWYYVDAQFGCDALPSTLCCTCTGGTAT